MRTFSPVGGGDTMDDARRGLILLGEDDVDQLELLSELLGHEGYQVASAQTPAEVIRRLADRPDLVLLDVVGVSTQEVFEAIAAMPARPALVLVSADQRLAQLAAKVNAEAALSKPYELGELLSIVEHALRARRLSREALGAPA